jgi:hypothetical protein
VIRVSLPALTKWDVDIITMIMERTHEIGKAYYPEELRNLIVLNFEK